MKLRQLKIFAAVFASYVGLSNSALAQMRDHQRVSFSSVFNSIQDARWEGRFSFKFAGVECSGPMYVRFFPIQKEAFAGNVDTVSYYHVADFSQNTDLFCSQLASRLSAVKVGPCTELRSNPDLNAMVPFRTIIPRGNEAFVSSSKCNEDGSISRNELKLVRADLSNNDQKLNLQILLEVGSLFDIDLNYELFRQ